MQPTLAAAEVRRNLTQYLSTTFALADKPVRDALTAFLNDPDHGIFRGLYLRVRTPFRRAEDSWRDHLEWAPEGFRPYRHQAAAFRRLSTLRGTAEPTLITTGTGSGKTESFLLPVLDHCRRERALGHDGVKAVLLYPMNALATDQAQRINSYLRHSALSQVSAGLYIGDTPETGYARVATRRGEIRRTRPDILITNYKMLDLLLQREHDTALWEGSRLAYVVVDEFHTYGGAQGTDVAMLLRRLASVTGHSEPGRPLGGICPVATSATLGEDASNTAGEAIREVAATVFGVEFDADAVVGEDRLDPAEFMDTLDYSLPLPDPLRVAAVADPHGDRDAAMDEITALFTDRRGLSPAELGAGHRRLPGAAGARRKPRLHPRGGTAPPGRLRPPRPVLPPDQPGHRRHRVRGGHRLRHRRGRPRLPRAAAFSRPPAGRLHRRAAAGVGRGRTAHPVGAARQHRGGAVRPGGVRARAHRGGAARPRRRPHPRGGPGAGHPPGRRPRTGGHRRLRDRADPSRHTRHHRGRRSAGSRRGHLQPVAGVPAPLAARPRAAPPPGSGACQRRPRNRQDHRGPAPGRPPGGPAAARRRPARAADHLQPQPRRRPARTLAGAGRPTGGGPGGRHQRRPARLPDRRRGDTRRPTPTHRRRPGGARVAGHARRTGRDRLGRRVPARRVEPGHPGAGRHHPRRLLPCPPRGPGPAHQPRPARADLAVGGALRDAAGREGPVDAPAGRRDRRAPPGGAGRARRVPLPARRRRRGPGPRPGALAAAARPGARGHRRHVPRRRHPPAHLRQLRVAGRAGHQHPGPLRAVDAQLPHHPADPAVGAGPAGRGVLGRPGRRHRHPGRVPVAAERPGPRVPSRPDLGGGAGRPGRPGAGLAGGGRAGQPGRGGRGGRAHPRPGLPGGAAAGRGGDPRRSHRPGRAEGGRRGARGHPAPVQGPGVPERGRGGRRRRPGAAAARGTAPRRRSTAPPARGAAVPFPAVRGGHPGPRPPGVLLARGPQPVPAARLAPVLSFVTPVGRLPRETAHRRRRRVQRRATTFVIAVSVTRTTPRTGTRRMASLSSDSRTPSSGIWEGSAAEFHGATSTR
ncbi:DEAD/DEAH box helicase [Thermobifida halotolerans]|uniref:DEAD/DEAH box helicase n=1 Tax=Thermobifida halotolerans TaxID=483545 RepID=A0AA97M137_9ACTN|nr:DEAD/DEAH box helicase [Thermobifida halotolerans]